MHSLLWVFLLRLACAKMTYYDTYQSFDTWQFLSNFCYAKVEGKLFISMKPTNMRSRVMVTYYADMSDEWVEIYKNPDESCQWKVDQSRYDGILASDIYNLPDHTLELDVDNSRPRWWYIVLFNCDSNDPYPMDMDFINITHTNGNITNHWEYHFSHDEQGIAQFQIFFLVVNACMIGLWQVVKEERKKAKQQFKVIKILQAVACFVVVETMFYTIHNGKYATDGVGHPGVKEFANVWHFVAEMLMLLCILNLGCGAYVSTNHVEQQRPIYLVIIVYFLLQLSMCVWDIMVRDPAAVLYLYQSAPGYCILAVRMLAMAWFQKNMRKTIRYEKHPIRSKFYVTFQFIAFCWFLILPTIVGIAAVFPSYMRAKYVYAFSAFMEQVIVTMFYWLFQPGGDVPLLGTLACGCECSMYACVY
jgi:hypothetical protein